MIITVGGTKGGGGKTTIATNLAVMRSAEGREVLLVDADDQATASSFTSLRNSNRKVDGAGYTSVRLLGEEILHGHTSLREKYEDIVIDAGGRDTDSHRAALVVANVALIPFQPSSFDVWELGKASKVIRETRTVNPSLHAFTLINMADPRGLDNTAAAEYAEDVDGLEFIPASIVTRKAFRRAAAQGLSVTELRPQDPKAAHEMRTLFEFAFGLGGTKQEAGNA